MCIFSYIHDIAGWGWGSFGSVLDVQGNSLNSQKFTTYSEGTRFQREVKSIRFGRNDDAIFQSRS